MPRFLRHACLAAAFLFPAILAQAQTIYIWPPRPPHPAPPPTFVPPPPIPTPALELRSHQVNVTIRDQIATTRVEQVFYNGQGRAVEGTFVFPLPKGAKIDRFSMDVNGVDTEAELLDAGKARTIYEDIVRRACDPALLEFMDHDLLKARVFPIEAHGEKRVTLTYTHLLPSDAGLVSYSYPLVGRTVEGRPVQKVSMKLDLESSQPIANVYSPSHPVEIKRRDGRNATVGLETDAAGGNFELYFMPAAAGERVAVSLLTFRDPARTSDDGYFLLLASPRADAKAEALPKDIVFVLDTSGSMSSEKLEQAKRALNFCLDNLSDVDRFEIVRFSTDVEPLFNGLQPADAQHRDEARAFVKKLKPIGGTAIHSALGQAMTTVGKGTPGRPAFVVFLTDGRPTIGDTDPARIVDAVQKSAGDTRIFCFGIGTDINTHLLDELAEKGRAATEYVLPDEDIELKVSRFYTKIAQPVMTDLKLEGIGGVRLTAVHPGVLPDLFEGEQLVVFGRYSGGGDAAVRLTGSVGAQRVTLESPTAKPSDAHASIPQLWATRRVGYLLDEIRLRGENAELRDEVVQLARAFGIVTPYTTYLIVEDEAARAVPIERQSFFGVTSDAMARREVEHRYQEMRDLDTGAGGVAGASSNAALKAAQAPQAAAEASEWAMGSRLSLVAPATPSAGPAPALQPVVGYQQNARHVKGRTFVQNGPQWVDTQSQALPASAVAQRVVFNSDAYFQLLKDHPEAAAWLSVARNLRVVIGTQLYEIVEES